MKALIVMAVLLSGCSVTGPEIKQMQEVCEVNGGLAQVTPAGFFLSFGCNNTAKFTMD